MMTPFNSLKAQTYNLVWSDEFNGSSVNTSDWNFETGGSGWGNNELQYYRAENATVSGGFLTITAKKESFGGRNYTSARMTTAGKRTFTYGKMEARLQIPMGSGLWPAFWMLGSSIGSGTGWPYCGEIDIMEHINTENQTHGTIHWQGPNGYSNYGGAVSTNPANFHVYSVEWTPSEIKWFLDGAQYHVANIQNGINSTQEFHSPFFFLLNLAVGGNWPGFNIDESKLPARYVVDYVRAYQLGNTPPPTGAPIGQTIWLRGSNNQYVSSENGASPMYCNRASVQAWEKFVVVDAGGGKIALRSTNKYVSSENGTAPINCNRTSIGDWEKFDWVGQGSGLVALRGNNGRYISSENGTAAMTCNRTAIGGWEVFSYATTSAARLGLPEVTLNSDEVSFYPNPTINKITYKLPAGTKHHSISVKDAQGKKITNLSFDNVGVENTIDVSGWKSGIYILNISDGGFTKTLKVQKQ